VVFFFFLAMGKLSLYTAGGQCGRVTRDVMEEVLA
jgi:hypothetical protein